MCRQAAPLVAPLAAHLAAPHPQLVARGWLWWAARRWERPDRQPRTTATTARGRRSPARKVSNAAPSVKS